MMTIVIEGRCFEAVCLFLGQCIENDSPLRELDCRVREEVVEENLWSNPLDVAYKYD